MLPVARCDRCDLGMIMVPLVPPQLVVRQRLVAQLGVIVIGLGLVFGVIVVGLRVPVRVLAVLAVVLAVLVRVIIVRVRAVPRARMGARAVLVRREQAVQAQVQVGQRLDAQQPQQRAHQRQCAARACLRPGHVVTVERIVDSTERAAGAIGPGQWSYVPIARTDRRSAAARGGVPGAPG